MYDSFSVRAVLSAKEDSSFKSTFRSAQSTVSSLTDVIKSGFGFGVGMKVADGAISLVKKGVSTLTNSLGDAISRYDTLKNFPEVMKKIGISAEDASKAQDKLVKGIDGLPTTLDSIVANVQSVTMVTRDIDKSTDLVLALNNAFLGSGSSSEAAERGMTQFTQALAKGKFQGDEWNVLLETMGPAIYKVANYMGYNGTNAANDLKNALDDGSVSVDDFCQAFIDMNGEVEIGGKKFEGFEAMARSSTGGIQTSITNLKTTVVKNLANMLEELDTKIGENGTSISGHLDNIKTIVNDTFKKIIASPQFDKLAEAFNKAFSYLEKILPKVIDGALEILGYLVDKGFEVAEAFMDAGREIKDTAEKTGTANIVMEGLKGIIDGVANVFKFAAEMLKKFKDPIVWVIQHIPEIIKLIIGIKTAEAVVNKVATFVGFINNVTKTVKSVKSGVEKMTSFFSNMASGISKLFNKGLGDSGSAFSNFAKVAQSKMGNVQQYASKAGTSIYNISDNFTGVTNVAKSATSTIKDGMVNISTSASTAGQGLSSAISSGFTSATNSATTGVSSITGSLSGINTYATNAGSSVYSIGGNFTNLASTASGTSSSITGGLSNISTTASSVGNSVTTNIGGSFTTASSTAQSGISSITGSLGGLMAGLGAAVGIVASLVTAIIKWKEEQYKAGKAMHEMTDEQKQFIDSCAETCKAYENIQTAAQNTYAEKEADISMTELLMSKYQELVDENGKVIKGKEQLAETLMGQVCESLGMEKSQVETLRGEYRNLIDDNGKVKQGYEERADEILGELAQAWGLEKSDIAEIIGKNKDLTGTIADVTQAKRENAKVEAITEAEKQAVKDQIQLQSEQRQLTQLQKQAQEEYDSFLAEHGDHLHKLTDEQRGEYDQLRENLNKYDTALNENQIALKETENVQRICGDALVANAEGNTEALNNCWMQLTEGIKDHTNGSREELQQQVLDAQEYLQQKKEAYEKNANDTTKAEMEEAEKRLQFMSQEYNALLDNQDGYLTQSLQAQRDAAKKELDEAQAHLDEINRRNRLAAGEKYKESTTAAKELVAQKKQALDDIEKDLNASLITQESLDKKHNATVEKDNKTSLDNQKQNMQNFFAQTAKLMSENNKTKETLNNNSNKTQENNLSTSLQNEKDIYNAAYGQIEQNVISHGNTVVSATNSSANEVNRTIDNQLNNAVSAVGNKQSSFNASATRSAQGINNGFSVLNNLSSSVGRNMQNVVTAIANKSGAAANQAGMVANNTMRSMLNVLQAQRTQVMGMNVMIGLINGLNARSGSVINTARNIANAVTNTISSALRIGSPSKITTQFGIWTGDGLVNGLASKIKDASITGKNIALATTNSLSDTLDKTMPDNLILFPGTDAISSELDRIEQFKSPDVQVRSMAEANQNIVLEANFNVDGRNFTQAIASNTSRAISENKRRRRA